MSKVSMHNKAARREGARKRFKIIPRSNMDPMPSEAGYIEYLERKRIEAVSLGITTPNSKTPLGDMCGC